MKKQFENTCINFSYKNLEFTCEILSVYKNVDSAELRVKVTLNVEGMDISGYNSLHVENFQDNIDQLLEDRYREELYDKSIAVLKNILENVKLGSRTQTAEQQAALAVKKLDAARREQELASWFFDNLFKDENK